MAPVPSPDPLTCATSKMRPLSHIITYDEKTLLWQTAIHITFLLSALAVAGVDRLMPATVLRRAEH